MTIRFLKDYGEYRKGQAYALKKTEAKKLILLGVARVDKMLTNFKVN